MNIAIHNYLTGSYLLESEPQKWDAIVILDTGLTHSNFVSRYSRRFLYLYFDDVIINSLGRRAPSHDDIKDAIEFSGQSDNLLVCCRAGQSRSAATAFVICHIRKGADAALELLNPKRHIPNTRIIEIGSILTNGDSVSRVFQKWQTDHKHVRLSDYYEEIERELDELESRGAKNRIIEFPKT